MTRAAQSRSAPQQSLTSSRASSLQEVNATARRATRTTRARRWVSARRTRTLAGVATAPLRPGHVSLDWQREALPCRKKFRARRRRLLPRRDAAREAAACGQAEVLPLRTPAAGALPIERHRGKARGGSVACRGHGQLPPCRTTLVSRRALRGGSEARDSSRSILIALCCRLTIPAHGERGIKHNAHAALEADA